MNHKLLSYGLIPLLTTVITLPTHAGDIEKGKMKAAVCAGCHGIDGVGLGDEFPNLAGQKKSYLVKQLKAFKAGTRIDPTMKPMADILTEEDMENVASYFSSLSSTPVASTETKKIITDKSSSKEFPETIHVTMKKSASIQAFPAEETWEGGPNMLYDAVTPNGKILLSTSPSKGTVYIFDTSNGKQLAVTKVGKAPKGVKVTPDGKLAYVSNQDSSDVSVIDLSTFKVVDTIKTEDGPHNVRFTNDGKIAYVTLQGGAGIGIIDTKTRKMTSVIPVEGITGPHNLDLSFDEKTAFVRDFVHHVAVLDLVTKKVKKVITVGNGHGGIDVSPNGKFAATAAIGDKIVTIIDTKTLEAKNIEVGNGPHGIRFSKDNNWLYVTITKDNLVCVINVKTMTIEKKISVGKFPFWIAVQGNS